MGILKGHVELIGLGNLLQSLNKNNREGVLTLCKDPEHKAFYLDARGMQLHSSTMKRINRLGRILMRKHLVDQKTLDELLEKQKVLGWKLGKIAVTSGLAKPDDVELALREQVEEEIFEMFMWKDSTFEFRQTAPGAVPRPNNPLSSLVFDENITSLLLEAMRREDELRMIRQVVREEDVLLRTGEEILVDRLGNDVEAVDAILSSINGRNCVRDLLAASLYPRFTTMRAIYLLLSNRYVRPVETRHLVAAHA